jgi:ankyrin repeat protein
VEAGADVNARSENDWTALKLAKENRYAPIVELLRAAGAEEQ